MKFTININQKAVFDLGLIEKLDVIDLAIFAAFKDFANANKCQKMMVGKTIYFWIDYRLIIDELPICRIKTKDGVYRRMRNLAEAGIIEFYPDNQKIGKSFFCWGENYDAMITDSPTDEKPKGVRMKNRSTYGLKTEGGTDEKPYNHYTNNNTTNNHSTKSNSAEINSAIPEIPFESKPKEKGTPGAENWAKEIAILFDRINKEESEAAGIDLVEFNWQANSGMNFGALANIKKVLIADIKAKNNIPDDHTLKISFEHIFRCGFRLLLDNANGVGGLFSFTPMKIYKKYDDIKSFAHRGRQVKRTKSDLINEQRAKAIYEIATDDSEPGLFGY